MKSEEGAESGDVNLRKTVLDFVLILMQKTLNTYLISD